jgi:plastocyanin
VSATEGAPAPVTMMDNFFDPLCLAMSSTQALSVTNAGNLDHNLTIQGSDLSITLAPGEEDETSEIGEFVQAGTHRFFCEFHEADGMVGTIVVE